ncbi:MAG: hypothetical protein HKN32_05050 [Flavobacteriales bacterium]|nr:hypothetical protein [Flavobacteriales bacterium]
MKNLIVSLEKLPSEVLKAINAQFPEGWDDLAFNFRMPTNNEVYRVMRFSTDTINYLIKLEKKKLDRPDLEEI